MNFLKKTTLTLLSLSSPLVLAGTMGPVCVQGSATIPCPTNAWEIGVQALYLKPTYGSFSGFFSSNTDTTGALNTQGIPDPWGWGFKLNGAYHFNTGNDLNLNWTHYNNTTTNSPYSIASPAISLVNNDTKWNAVNAEFGQLIQFGSFNHLRLHGGAQYAQITENINISTPGSAAELISMQYSGFGPRLGADLSYDVGYGFGIYANGMTALLMGQHNYNSSFSGIFESAGKSYGSYYGMVPELEGKLGATYTYAMPQGNLSVDIGYLWLNYFNAQAYGAISYDYDSFDFALNGPYIGLKWLG